jgi:glycosyltransferase involved in cell wall biosynthesis
MSGTAAGGAPRRGDGAWLAAGNPDELRVSVVIPAHNEARRLPVLLAGIAERFASPDLPPTHVEVVDDGSDPRQAAAVAAAVAAADSRLSAASARCAIGLTRSPSNRGKGHAVRLGWSQAAATAQWLGFVDADGSISAAELARLVSLLEASAPFDVLAGSRVALAGRRIVRRWHRHAQGRVFAAIVERAFRLGVYDTQCGVKFVRGDALRPLLPLLREEGWMLDVELLALLRQRGARLREEPIDWVDAGESQVVPVLDPLRMLAAVWRIRRSLSQRREPR